MTWNLEICRILLIPWNGGLLSVCFQSIPLVWGRILRKFVIKFVKRTESSMMTSSRDLYCFSPSPRAAASPIANMQHVGLAMYREYTENDNVLSEVSRRHLHAVGMNQYARDLHSTYRLSGDHYPTIK
jgi:hypothetical protein